MKRQLLDRNDLRIKMISIHKAIKEELNDIFRIEQLSFKPKDAFGIGQFKHFFNGKKRSSDLYVVLALNLVIGYFIIRYYEKSNRIYSIAVNPEFRQRGIATLMLDKIHELSVGKNIILEVRKDNKVAIDFYKKHGYKEEQIIHNYYKDGMSAIKMRKVFDEIQG